MPYHPIDHTGDAGMEVTAKTIEGLFEEAALAFTDLMVDPASVKPTLKRSVELSARDLEQLMVDWLTELLFLYETEKLLFSRFHVQITGACHPERSRRVETRDIFLVGTMRGERFSVPRHPIKTAVKAVTYHKLKITKTKEGYGTTIIFDL